MSDAVTSVLVALIVTTGSLATVLLTGRQQHRLLRMQQNISDGVERVHILVNSTMTASVQANLDATERELAMTLEVIALRRDAGREPTPESIAAVDSARERIAALRETLADRVKQTEIGEAQIHR